MLPQKHFINKSVTDMKYTNPDHLIQLIQSLTKAEKRYFRLYANLQSGEKNYLFLFDLINKGIPSDEVYRLYCQEENKNNFDMAAKHLYRVIMDCLVHLRKKEDVQATIFNYITKADILFERELFEEAFNQLNKAQKLAATYENDPLLLLIRRTELKYLSSLGFNEISERELVNKQMKINDIMKYSRNINLHLQLYDILKHRIANKGYIRSEKQKDNLNDLVLSELNLIANNSYKGFEARKLHLLFQATYYLNTGNYKSAIRFYQELITLFESNQHLILKSRRNGIIEKVIDLIIIFEPYFQFCRMNVHIHLCRIHFQIQHINREFPDHNSGFISILHSRGNNAVFDETTVDEQIFIIAIASGQFRFSNQSRQAIISSFKGNFHHGSCRFFAVNVKHRSFCVTISCCVKHSRAVIDITER